MNEHFFYDYLISLGIADYWAVILNATTLSIIILILLTIVYWIVFMMSYKVSIQISKKSKTILDDFLITNKLPSRFSKLIPTLLAFKIAPYILVDYPETLNFVLETISIINIFLIYLFIRAFLKSLKMYLQTLPKLKDKPIISYFQIVQIFVNSTLILIVIAILFDVNIFSLFTYIGTASAILILVFKDTIMGVVSSIQVTLNDIIRIGDWVTFSKYGADGDVIEINLTTVKIQNFDMTITTIPTYSLVSESFKNWRGMHNSTGRRIKRSIIISQKSIHYLGEKEIKKLKGIDLIKHYLESKEEEIKEYNQQNKVNKMLLINGRNLTNFGVFRKYIDQYLNQHPAINQEMIIMTRQLKPTTQGIPLEIYAFSKDKRWENYEYIMADIFDHILSAIPYFSLEVFELDSYKAEIN